VTAYIIQAGDGGPVKIGWAKDVKKRLKRLQTGHYERLEIIRTIEGGRALGRHFHVRYAANNLTGEWFTFCDEMLQWLPEEPIPETDHLCISVPSSPEWQFIERQAEALNVKKTTIKKWRDRGCVPHRHRIRLLEIACVRRFILDPAMFDICPKTAQTQEHRR